IPSPVNLLNSINKVFEDTLAGRPTNLVDLQQIITSNHPPEKIQKLASTLLTLSFLLVQNGKQTATSTSSTSIPSSSNGNENVGVPFPIERFVENQQKTAKKRGRPRKVESEVIKDRKRTRDGSTPVCVSDETHASSVESPCRDSGVGSKKRRQTLDSSVVGSGSSRGNADDVVVVVAGPGVSGRRESLGSEEPRTSEGGRVQTERLEGRISEDGESRPITESVGAGAIDSPAVINMAVDTLLSISNGPDPAVFGTPGSNSTLPPIEPEINGDDGTNNPQNQSYDEFDELFGDISDLDVVSTPLLDLPTSESNTQESFLEGLELPGLSLPINSDMIISTATAIPASSATFAPLSPLSQYQPELNETPTSIPTSTDSDPSISVSESDQSSKPKPINVPYSTPQVPKDPTTKRYHCPRPGCEFNAERFYNFKLHWGTHIGVSSKIFECPDCRKAFRRRSDLVRHVNARIHEKVVVRTKVLRAVVGGAELGLGSDAGGVGSGGGDGERSIRGGSVEGVDATGNGLAVVVRGVSNSDGQVETSDGGGGQTGSGRRASGRAAVITTADLASSDTVAGGGNGGSGTKGTTSGGKKKAGSKSSSRKGGAKKAVGANAATAVTATAVGTSSNNERDPFDPTFLLGGSGSGGDGGMPMPSCFTVACIGLRHRNTILKFVLFADMSDLGGRSSRSRESPDALLLRFAAARRSQININNTNTTAPSSSHLPSLSSSSSSLVASPKRSSSSALPLHRITQRLQQHKQNSTRDPSFPSSPVSTAASSPQHRLSPQSLPITTVSNASQYVPVVSVPSMASTHNPDPSTEPSSSPPASLRRRSSSPTLSDAMISAAGPQVPTTNLQQSRQPITTTSASKPAPPPPKPTSTPSKNKKQTTPKSPGVTARPTKKTAKRRVIRKIKFHPPPELPTHPPLPPRNFYRTQAPSTEETTASLNDQLVKTRSKLSSLKDIREALCRQLRGLHKDEIFIRERMKETVYDGVETSEWKSDWVDMNERIWKDQERYWGSLDRVPEEVVGRVKKRDFEKKRILRGGVESFDDDDDAAGSSRKRRKVGDGGCRDDDDEQEDEDHDDFALGGDDDDDEGFDSDDEDGNESVKITTRESDGNGKGIDKRGLAALESLEMLDTDPGSSSRNPIESIRPLLFASMVASSSDSLAATYLDFTGDLRTGTTGFDPYATTYSFMNDDGDDDVDFLLEVHSDIDFDELEDQDATGAFDIMSGQKHGKGKEKEKDGGKENNKKGKEVAVKPKAKPKGKGKARATEDDVDDADE
ncbi:hypothetical protein HDU76_012736, partial [Blyttiomyces sp. JEL0837]